MTGLKSRFSKNARNVQFHGCGWNHFGKAGRFSSTHCLLISSRAQGESRCKKIIFVPSTTYYIKVRRPIRFSAAGCGLGPMGWTRFVTEQPPPMNLGRFAGTGVEVVDCPGE